MSTSSDGSDMVGCCGLHGCLDCTEEVASSTFAQGATVITTEALNALKAERDALKGTLDATKEALEELRRENQGLKDELDHIVEHMRAEAAGRVCLIKRARDDYREGFHRETIRASVAEENLAQAVALNERAFAMLEAFVDKTAENARKYVRCLYCGTKSERGGAARTHIESCEKHPMAALRRERDELKERLTKAEDFIRDEHFAGGQEADRIRELEADNKRLQAAYSDMSQELRRVVEENERFKDEVIFLKSVRSGQAEVIKGYQTRVRR